MERSSGRTTARQPVFPVRGNTLGRAARSIHKRTPSLLAISTSQVISTHSDVLYICTCFQVAGWAVTTRGKGSLRSAVLGHNVDFHQESDCVDDVQPDNVICAKNRCRPQIVIFHSLTLLAGVTGSSVDPHSVQQVPTDSFRCAHLRNRKTLFSKVDQLFLCS